MAKLRRRLEELQTRTMERRNLSEVVGYFHDHLANHPALHRGSSSVDSELFIEVVQAALRRAISPTSNLKRARVMRYADTDFLHGAGMFAGSMAVFFLFESTGLGIITTCRESTHYIRFSMLQFPPEAGPSAPAKGVN